jgi:hypothetical protein
MMPANLSFLTRLVPAPRVRAWVMRAPRLLFTWWDLPSRQMRARWTKAPMMIAIERAKTKYISHGVEMLKKTSREASVVRAVSAAEMAPMMATGMTRPPQLARKRVPFGAFGSFCGIEVMRFESRPEVVEACRRRSRRG